MISPKGKNYQISFLLDKPEAFKRLKEFNRKVGNRIKAEVLENGQHYYFNDLYKLVDYKENKKTYRFYFAKFFKEQKRVAEIIVGKRKCSIEPICSPRVIIGKREYEVKPSKFNYAKRN